MNCTKCGAPVEDNAVFCGECGAAVVAMPAEEPVIAPADAADVAAPMTAAAVEGEAASTKSNFQQNIQNAAQTAKQKAQSAAKSVSENELVGNTVDIFKHSFTKPSAAADSVVSSKNLLPGMLLIAVQCVVLIILFSIHYPGISSANFGHRLGAAVVKALAFAALYAVEAYTITLKKDPSKNVTFKAAFSAIGTQTVYSTTLLVLSFVFGLFSGDISSILQSLITVVYTTLSSKVIYNYVDGDDDKKSITTVIIAVVGFLCFYILNILAGKALWA